MIIILIIILIVLILLILLILLLNKSKFNPVNNFNDVLINFCSFYTEGPPNDEGKFLSDCVPEINKNAQGHFNKITFYTPKILRELGYGKYLREYKLTPLIQIWSPIEKIGLSSFRPAMFLHELSKMNDGDILFHRDINWKKYSYFTNFDNIDKVIKKCLQVCQFDFFVPAQPPGTNSLIRHYVKTKVIKELGEDNPFTYEYPIVHCYMFIMRKSKVTIELLTEWQRAMENDEWLNGESYGMTHEGFMNIHCLDQAILSVIIANWIRKGKYNIPKKYPSINSIDYTNNNVSSTINYDYLKILDKK